MNNTDFRFELLITDVRLDEPEAESITVTYKITGHRGSDGYAQTFVVRVPVDAAAQFVVGDTLEVP